MDPSDTFLYNMWNWVMTPDVYELNWWVLQLRMCNMIMRKMCIRSIGLMVCGKRFSMWLKVARCIKVWRLKTLELVHFECTLSTSLLICALTLQLTLKRMWTKLYRSNGGAIEWHVKFECSFLFSWEDVWCNVCHMIFEMWASTSFPRHGT